MNTYLTTISTIDRSNLAEDIIGKERWFNFRFFWAIFRHKWQKDKWFIRPLLALAVLSFIGALFTEEGNIFYPSLTMFTGLFASAFFAMTFIESKRQYQLEKKYKQNTKSLMSDFYFCFLSHILINYKHYLKSKNIKVEIKKTTSINYLKFLQKELDENTFKEELEYRSKANKNFNEMGLGDKFNLLYTDYDNNSSIHNKFKIKNENLLIYTFVKSNMLELSIKNNALNSAIKEYKGNKACKNIDESLYQEFNTELNNEIQNALTTIEKDPYLKFIYNNCDK